MHTIIDNIPVWGTPLDNAVQQMRAARDSSGAFGCALMADHHLGYSVPVGGVIAYQGKVSPSGVGYDIACGNKAVLTDLKASDLGDMSKIMDEVWRRISFGVGRKNNNRIEHALFDNDVAWDIPVAGALKEMARDQLGTVGSGNHYVDIFLDEEDRVWIGVHFGSRGLGHKLATHFIREGGGTDGINVAPVTLDANSDLGQQYIACMKLAGRYAYAGRDWVCKEVADILGGQIRYEVHNHHNFAWEEEHFGLKLWVVRKGATPAFPGQIGFVGGTMGEQSVILCGGPATDQSKLAFFSTVHGAGRLMSRTEAAGKVKWKNGVRTRVSTGKISQPSMDEWLQKAGVTLRGGGLDEAPQAYKRLSNVLEAHKVSTFVLHNLRPIGVAMAGAGEIDPFKD